METIFDRYGGQEFWDSILNYFYFYNLKDHELANYFQGKNVEKIKKFPLSACAALRTTGEHFPVSVKRVHKSLPINNGVFENLLIISWEH